MGETFFILPEVSADVKLGSSWIYDAVKRGDFPKPIHLTPRRVVWRKSDIEKWKADRVAASLAASEKGGAK